LDMGVTQVVSTPAQQAWDPHFNPQYSKKTCTHLYVPSVGCFLSHVQFMDYWMLFVHVCVFDLHLSIRSIMFVIILNCDYYISPQTSNLNQRCNLSMWVSWWTKLKILSTDRWRWKCSQCLIRSQFLGVSCSVISFIALQVITLSYF
jgi:hypothetical protein